MRSSLVNGLSTAFLAAVVAASVAAAAPKKPAAQKKPASPSGAAQIAAGQKVFGSAGCVGCHKLAGKGGTSGPDLSKIGAEHDAAWIANKAKNPKATNPNSIMPAFAGSPKDLASLSAYLASLK